MPVHQTAAGAVRGAVMARRGRSARLLGAAQIGLGCVLIAGPDRVAATAAGPSGTPAPGWLVRVLGFRSLIQGALTAARPTVPVLAGGTIVDATHAASMLPLIAVSQRYRRAAFISALAATASVAAGAVALDTHAVRQTA